MGPTQLLAVAAAVHRPAQPTISSTTTTAAQQVPYRKAQAETEVEVDSPTRRPTIRITPSGPLRRMAPIIPTHIRIRTDQPAEGSTPRTTTVDFRAVQTSEMAIPPLPR